MPREGPPLDDAFRDRRNRGEFKNSTSQERKRGYIEDCVPHQSKRLKQSNYDYYGNQSRRNDRPEGNMASLPRGGRFSFRRSPEHQYARARREPYAPRGGQPSRGCY